LDDYGDFDDYDIDDDNVTLSEAGKYSINQLMIFMTNANNNDKCNSNDNYYVSIPSIWFLITP